MTPNEILNLPMQANDACARNIRHYLCCLLEQLLLRGEGFSGKRPFGNSGWEWDLYTAMVRGGAIAGKFDEDGNLDTFDRAKADELLQHAILVMSTER